MKIFSKIDNIIYNIKCYFSPYNVVKIKTLPRVFKDRNETLLHASFQILVDFVEKEHKNGIKDCYYDVEEEKKRIQGESSYEDQIEQYQSQSNFYLEVSKLYNWWTKERPKRKDPTDSRVGANREEELKIINESQEFEDACDKEDNDMLKRLIDIRMSLWT